MWIFEIIEEFTIAFLYLIPRITFLGLMTYGLIKLLELIGA